MIPCFFRNDSYHTNVVIVLSACFTVLISPKTDFPSVPSTCNWWGWQESTYLPLFLLLSTDYSLLSQCRGPALITMSLLHVPLDDPRISDPALSGFTLIQRALLSVICFALHSLFVGQWRIQRSLVKTPYTTYDPRTHNRHLVISWACAGDKTLYANAKHHTLCYSYRFVIQLLLLPKDKGQENRLQCHWIQTKGEVGLVTSCHGQTQFSSFSWLLVS